MAVQQPGFQIGPIRDCCIAEEPSQIIQPVAAAAVLPVNPGYLAALDNDGVRWPSVPFDKRRFGDTKTFNEFPDR